MTNQQYTIKLKTIIEEYELEVLYAASDYETHLLTTHDVSRPGLQLSGFYDYFTPARLQIIGLGEGAYLSSLSQAETKERLDKFMSYKPTALVFCNGVKPGPMMLFMAQKYDVTIAYTDRDTSMFMAQVINTLRTYLAERITVHGVLVRVYGEGILLIGDSGVGKSETALELIKRGHQLVADDAVEIRRMNRKVISGASPGNIRYMMEVRGVGIINVKQMYGVGAVLPHCTIHMVINFEKWIPGTEYDRLGLEEHFENYLGVEVPKITVPVAPGRNLATIIETAALNNRSKKMGYNAARSFIEALDNQIMSGQNEAEDDIYRKL